MQQYLPIIPALGRLKQEDLKVKARLGHTMRLVSKIKMMAVRQNCWHPELSIPCVLKPQDFGAPSGVPSSLLWFYLFLIGHRRSSSSASHFL
jgi:hypothetical protein